MSGNHDHYNVTCGTDGNWVDPASLNPSWPTCVYKCKVPVAETGYNALDSSQIVRSICHNKLIFSIIIGGPSVWRARLG